MNYQSKFEEIISRIDGRPSILLHSCCGPCSTQVIDVLSEYFDVTVIYYNPNVEPLEEYEKRKKEQIRLLEILNIKYLESSYDNDEFIAKCSEYSSEKEGGNRCRECFKLRLFKTGMEAKDKFEYFGTTLTVSPRKNSQVINEVGALVQEEVDVKFLFSDFKKNDGYKKSIEFAKEYDLYRQKYCGCRYSFRD